MRRRPKESDAPGMPPLPLQRYRGSTNREALAWITAREAWWTEARDPEDGGWLPFLLEGWEQVGNLSWCGALIGTCHNRDCLCWVWPEHLDTQNRPRHYG